MLTREVAVHVGNGSGESLFVLCLGKENGVGDHFELCSQASDSMWRMPGHTEAMKAVVSCDKPGGAAHTH